MGTFTAEIGFDPALHKTALGETQGIERQRHVSLTPVAPWRQQGQADMALLSMPWVSPSAVLCSAGRSQSLP